MAWDTKASPWDWDSGTVLLQDHGCDYRKRAPGGGWANEDDACLAGPQSGVVRPVLGTSVASFSSASSRIPGIVAASAIGDQSAFASLDQRRLAVTTSNESSFVLNRKDDCERGYQASGAQMGSNDNHKRFGERNGGFLELKNRPSSSCFGHNNLPTKDADMKVDPRTESCLGHSEQQGRLFLSSEARVEGAKEGSRAHSIEEQHSSTATGSVGSADSLTGLHLGKRTYFEDATGGAGTKGAKKPPVKSSASPKKSRAASSGVQMPRCQVEGCKIDLTSARGYHRRHKVCEMHSKAEKVTVANQEQRFCQQCSRFHVLAEFDDVKRSCRRRLASHNERRRKPQPDAFALNAQLSSAFHEWPSFFHHPRFTGMSSLWDDPGNFRSISFKGAWPRMVKSEDQPSYDCTVQVPGVDRELFWTGLSPHSNEKLPLLLLQSPKGMIPMPNDISSQRTHQLLAGSFCPVSNGLTLSSSSGAGVLSGLEAKSAAQVATRVTDSGRALSLLSAQTRGFDASGVVSLDTSTGKSITLDQFMCDNQMAAPEHLVPGGQHHFDYTTEKLLSASKSRNPLFASGVPAGGMSSMEKDHYAGMFIHGLNGPSSCESHSYFLPQQGHESRVPQDIKPTVDLMRILSVPHSVHPQGSSVALQHGNSAFGDLQYSYDPSFFES